MKKDIGWINIIWSIFISGFVTYLWARGEELLAVFLIVLPLHIIAFRQMKHMEIGE